MIINFSLIIFYSLSCSAVFLIVLTFFTDWFPKLNFNENVTPVHLYNPESNCPDWHTLY